jgi:hypothetical protein
VTADEEKLVRELRRCPSSRALTGFGPGYDLGQSPSHATPWQSHWRRELPERHPSDDRRTMRANQSHNFPEAEQ